MKIGVTFGAGQILAGQCGEGTGEAPTGDKVVGKLVERQGGAEIWEVVCGVGKVGIDGEADGIHFNGESKGAGELGGSDRLLMEALGLVGILAAEEAEDRLALIVCGAGEVGPVLGIIEEEEAGGLEIIGGGEFEGGGDPCIKMLDTSTEEALVEAGMETLAAVEAEVSLALMEIGPTRVDGAAEAVEGTGEFPVREREGFVSKIIGRRLGGEILEAAREGKAFGGSLAMVGELWPALFIPNDGLEGGFAAEGAIALVLHGDRAGA